MCEGSHPIEAVGTTRPPLQSLPCAAEMLSDQVQLPEFDAAKMQALLDGAYANNLY